MTPEVDLPDHLNLVEYFLERRLAEGRGARVALTIDSPDGEVRNVTYAEVLALAHRYAAALHAAGVRPEERVGIALDDGADWVGAFFGILHLGAVVVLLNPDLDGDELLGLVDYTGIRMVVAAPRVEERLTGRATILGPLGDHACPPRANTHRDDGAIWLFSGGTTGRPKAVAQSHGAFVNTTVLTAHGVYGYGPDDVTLSVPKLYFGYATGMNLLFPFSVGARAVLFPDRCTPERVAGLVARHRPTVLVNVPTFVGKLLRDAPHADLSSVRLSTSAGEALPEALFVAFREQFGVELLDGLGTAEMWHVFLTNRPGQVRPGTLGRPVPGFEVEVRDDEGRPLPDGDTGWLWVRGRSRALGYVRALEATARAFQGEWYVSGDMVRRDADGVFTYCGRGDDMLKVSGKWVAPRDVESCLSEHVAVHECAVVGVADAHGLTRLCAYVLPAPGYDAAELPTRLGTYLRARLQAYKVPREVIVVHAFSRTHLGKIDRGELRRLGASRE